MALFVFTKLTRGEELRGDLHPKPTGRVHWSRNGYKCGMRHSRCQPLSGPTGIAGGLFVRILFVFFSRVVSSEPSLTIFLRFNQIPTPVLSIYLQLVDSRRGRGRVTVDGGREREREYDMLINLAFICCFDVEACLLFCVSVW